MNQSEEVLECLLETYMDFLSHDGYADIRIEMKILKRGQKEVIIHGGRQYRFVIDVESMVD